MDISVIIPTMWKFPPFVQFVQDLARVGCVKEIIIIDNHPSNETTAEHEEIGHASWSKIKLLKMNENIGVNPAWNLGAARATSNILCFLNDDVIVDLKLFDRVSMWMNNSIGSLGICPGRPEWGQAEFVDGSIQFEPIPHNGNTFGFGCLFFVMKENWIPIPDGLKIYYGDDWVQRVPEIVSGKKAFWIRNCFFHTPYATTTKHLDVNNLLNHERTIYVQELDRIAFFEDEYKKACLNTFTDIYYHLPMLRALADQCNTVVEFGVRDGQSTRALLASKARQIYSYDIVEDYDVADLERRCEGYDRHFEYIIANVFNADVPHCDLLFIDTEHTKEQLTKELQMFSSFSRKYIAFHDTGEPYAKELLPVIMKFLADTSDWRVLYHTEECHGFTVLERISHD